MGPAIDTLTRARKLLARFGHNPTEVKSGGCELAGFTLRGAVARAAGRPYLDVTAADEWDELLLRSAVDDAMGYVLAVLGLTTYAGDAVDQAGAGVGTPMRTEWALGVLDDAIDLASRAMLTSRIDRTVQIALTRPTLSPITLRGLDFA